jgi:hypothetical protein
MFTPRAASASAAPDLEESSASYFRHCFTANTQSHQKAADLRRRSLSGHHDVESCLGILERQRIAGGSLGDIGF